jgi:hypothetical protein
MSTTVTSTDPTLPRYQCGSGCGLLTFNWKTRTPNNGRLGEVTLGQYVNKPIQVFDAQVIYAPDGTELLTNWAFQAQDGSFLGRMYVSKLKGFIRFAHFRASDQWPLVSCSVPVPDPRDSRDPLDRIP